MRATTDLAWAAGLFEGEGCASSRNAKHYYTAQVVMTDEDIIRRFHAVVGMGTVSGPSLRGGAPHRKPLWTWRVSGYPRVQALAAFFWPWLGERRRATFRAMLLRPSIWRRGGRCKYGHDASLFTRQGRRRVSTQCRQCREDAWRRFYAMNAGPETCPVCDKTYRSVAKHAGKMHKEEAA